MSGMIFSGGEGNSASLTIYQGKTLEATLIWGGNTPVNVTGWSARLTVRLDYTSASPTADFTVGNGRVVVGGADGMFTFTMSATDSAALTAPFTGVYEVEVTNDEGQVFRAVAGAVDIIPEVVK